MIHARVDCASLFGMLNDGFFNWSSRLSTSSSTAVMPPQCMRAVSLPLPCLRPCAWVQFLKPKCPRKYCSDAFTYGNVGSLVIALFRISCWMWQWKNFDNWSVVGEDTDKSAVSRFQSRCNKANLVVHCSRFLLCTGREKYLFCQNYTLKRWLQYNKSAYTGGLSEEPVRSSTLATHANNNNQNSWKECIRNNKNIQCKTVQEVKSCKLLFTIW